MGGHSGSWISLESTISVTSHDVWLFYVDGDRCSDRTGRASHPIRGTASQLDSSLSDAGLAHLKGLTKLSHLDLTDTQVTDAGLVHLKGLTKLS